MWVVSYCETAYVLSLTDENNFDLVCLGRVLNLWADLGEEMYMFCQKYVCVIASVSFY